MSIPTVLLASGQRIPVIGLGFYLVPKEQAAEVAYQGLKAGYRLLDSAQFYFNEKEVAEGFQRWVDEDPVHNKREDVIYTTKIWTTNHGYDKAKKSLEESLVNAKNFGYIDIVLIHQPYSDYKLRRETYQVLEEAVAAGTVRSIGVSNYGLKHVKEVLEYPDLKVKPSIDQVELHPGLSRPELDEFTKKNGILLQAYSPLMHANRLDDPDLVALSKKYGKSVAQILLRWSVQKGWVPLPKSTRPERIVADFDIFDFELTAAEVKKLTDWDHYLPFNRDYTEYPLDSEKK